MALDTELANFGCAGFDVAAAAQVCTQDHRQAQWLPQNRPEWLTLKLALTTKKGWIWVLRYRINGAEQTPLVVGLVDDFPTEDDASLEADRLGLRVRINCGAPQGGRMKYSELAEYCLKVEFDPEVTASPKLENTKPILEHYVRDILVAKWGNHIADHIEPLEIQKWFNALHN